MIGPRHAGRAGLTAFGVAIGLALVGGSAYAGGNNNHQQNPVAGEPQCADLFPGTSQLRVDAPGSDVNPTGTVPPLHSPPLAGFDQQVAVIVHGGPAGSNVYDATTGMAGRLIATENANGRNSLIDYTLVCYTTTGDPAASTGTATLTYSDSGHHVEVSIVVDVTPTTTAVPTTVAVAEATTTTEAATTSAPAASPTEVLGEVEIAAPAVAVPAQPSFTG